jgi:ABC-type multidrug transport system permease subunit
MSHALRVDVSTIRAMIERSRNELLRVPGAAIPGVLAPTIFFLGLTAVFGSLTLLPGFDTQSYQSFLIPVSLMQGAGFTGAATGVNLARDIENGLFDRFLASPAPRWVLLTGLVSSASLRALVPGTFLFIVAMIVGANFPGALGLLVAVVAVMGMGVVAACWGVALALKFKTQSAAPLMQAGMLVLILTTTAYAPQELLTGWLAEVARINPATQVVEMARQGFVGTVTWSGTWPGIVTLIGMIALLGAWALRGMRRTAF